MPGVGPAAGTRITVYEQLRRSYVGGLSSGTSGESDAVTNGDKETLSEVMKTYLLSRATRMPEHAMLLAGSGAGSSSSGSGSGNTSSTSTSTSTSSGNSVGLGAKLLMGLTAGAVGQAVAVPADLVKVRELMDGRGYYRRA